MSYNSNYREWPKISCQKKTNLKKKRKTSNSNTNINYWNNKDSMTLNWKN